MKMEKMETESTHVPDEAAIQCSLRVEPPHLLRIHPDGSIDRWLLSDVANVEIAFEIVIDEIVPTLRVSLRR